VARTKGALDRRPRRRRQYEVIAEKYVIDFPILLRKKTYREEIKRIMLLAFKGDHHADLLEVMMMFKRIKNL
jgi:hypothetical protein